MSKGFYKFKAKIKKIWLLKCIAYGLSLGVFVFATLLLLSKLEVLPISTTLSVLLGVGSAVVLSAALLFLLRPTDKRVAKRLDAELGLNEKVQTMIEFADKEGGMYDLQRRDADAKLSETPISNLKFKRIWVSGVTLALSLSLLCGTFIIPTKADDTPPADVVPPAIVNYRIELIKVLIENVKKAWLNEEFKNYLVGELESLITAISETEKVAVMKVAAIGTIKNIQNELYAKNSAMPICKELEKATDPILKELASTIIEFKFTKIKACFKDFEDKISDASAGDAILLIGQFNNELSLALENAGHHDDGFYTALESFSNGLTKITNTGNLSGYKDLIDDTLDAISDPLDMQSDNKRASDDVITELMEIFNIEEGELTESGVDVPTGSGGIVDGVTQKPPQTQLPETPSTQGGAGHGNLNIPSDDSVYNPETGEHNPYGDMLIDYITKYYTSISNLNLDAEMLEALQSYFESISNNNTN